MCHFKNECCLFLAYLSNILPQGPGLSMFAWCISVSVATILPSNREGNNANVYVTAAPSSSKAPITSVSHSLYNNYIANHALCLH